MSAITPELTNLHHVGMSSTQLLYTAWCYPAFVINSLYQDWINWIEVQQLLNTMASVIEFLLLLLCLLILVTNRQGLGSLGNERFLERRELSTDTSNESKFSWTSSKEGMGVALEVRRISRVVVYDNQIIFPFSFTEIHPHLLKQVVWEFGRNERFLLQAWTFL